MKAQPLILIIDDVVENVEVLGENLSDDYDIQFATSGPEGLALIERRRPDLVLLDLMMPGMDGYEVLATIKADPELAAIPVIFVTAQHDTESETRALAAGAVDFIHKPINGAVVRARVKVHLDLKRREAELKETLTELTRAHGELQVLSTAIEQSPTSVVICGPDGNIEYVNPRFTLETGYSAAEALGKNPRLLNSGLTDPTVFVAMWQHLVRGDPWTGEFINRRKSGEIFREEIHIAPVRDGHGQTTHYVAVKLDISERYEAAQQLARARARELEIGAKIQQTLLFSQLPTDLATFAVECHTEPCQGVDGDFFTFTRFSPHVFEVLIGDVMGKGVAAALIGAGVLSSYRKVFGELMATRASASPPTPAALMNALHQAVTPELIAVHTFVTMALLRFDSQARTLTWVNAGHSPALLAKRDGSAVRELSGDNLPLGVLAEERYGEDCCELAVGDTVLLYTDGLSEAFSPEQIQYGEARIKQVLQRNQQAQATPATMLAELLSDIREYTGNAPASDDQTALLIQLRGPDGAAA